LEQLHVLPNVSYLAKVRNTDDIPELAPKVEQAIHSQEKQHGGGSHEEKSAAAGEHH